MPAAAGTVSSNFIIFGKFFEIQSTAKIAIHIKNVAVIVLIIAEINPVNMEFLAPRFCRVRFNIKIKMTTWKYEHIAVESARPAVFIGQIRVRLRIMFRKTAITALRIGVFESCIE